MSIALFLDGIKVNSFIKLIAIIMPIITSLVFFLDIFHVIAEVSFSKFTE
jgi:hypothetical protein